MVGGGPEAETAAAGADDGVALGPEAETAAMDPAHRWASAVEHIPTHTVASARAHPDEAKQQWQGKRRRRERKAREGKRAKAEAARRGDDQRPDTTETEKREKEERRGGREEQQQAVAEHYWTSSSSAHSTTQHNFDGWILEPQAQACAHGAKTVSSVLGSSLLVSARMHEV